MKKYTNIHYNDINILKNAIIGFEFEFYSELSYYMLLTKLNFYLSPIEVLGFKVYHSSFKPDENHFKIECDFSGGADMIELITGKLKYVDSKIILLKILKFIQENCSTTEKSSIHINISFDKEKTNKTLDKLNPFKLILNTDENYIYSLFPNRKDNYYARSIKNLIPFKGFDYASAAMKKIAYNLIDLPNTKYYGINIANVHTGRLEFRYVGGLDYQFKTNEILELMDYFIILTYNSIDVELDESDNSKLRDYLMKNINQFKNFSSYETFISEFPTIKLQVNKSSTKDIIKTYYNSFYEKMYDLIINTQNIKDCIINYNLDNGKLEVVNATFNGIGDLEDYIFINCSINSGIYENCSFYNVDAKNTHIYESKLTGCNLFNNKIENCYSDIETVLDTCYIFNSKIEGSIEGYSIVRSSVLTDTAVVGDNVEIVNDIYYFGNKNKTDKDDSKKVKYKS